MNRISYTQYKDRCVKTNAMEQCTQCFIFQSVCASHSLYMPLICYLNSKGQYVKPRKTGCVDQDIQRF